MSKPKMNANKLLTQDGTNVGGWDGTNVGGWDGSNVGGIIKNY